MKKIITILLLFIGSLSFAQNEVHNVVDVYPEFVGGQEAMLKYFDQNLQYPETAKASNVEGMVHYTFVVNADGSISDLTLISGVNAELDAEAKRLIEEMPAWTPGKKDGQNVRTLMRLPVDFKL
ncbi:energy transducer TonB [Paracrocinitomix mangrovi]|uniref:energy transducer TonB n=1 Tax=Paracrocinitomix mangrovi TaxID=2862509 RepID=UPI001C8E6437|nr:energy transducer TonB [Paracrocinitomix mangrovi]UKN02152.1 energy transducer TonB [Paracrocinitomix mangrovi]